MDLTLRGSFSSSRPPSRAWSESTERPESSTGPRTISQEIDHIKTLITRAKDGPQQHSGSVTAVLFRNRNQSGEIVTHTHIFHELDTLKKRIKQEQQTVRPTLERRISQIDPGQESESEADSVFDDRDEELERVQEKFQKQKEQLESLLESAEHRVDSLTAEKDRLREQLRKSTSDKQSMQAALQATQKDTTRLSSQVQDFTRALQENQKLLEEIRAEKSGADHARQRAEERVADLEARRIEIEASSAIANEKLVKLERDNKQVIKRLQEVLDAHAESDQILKEELRTVRARCDSVTSERDQHSATNATLRQKLQSVEASASQTQAKLQTRCEELEAQAEEQRTRLTDSLKVVEKYSNDHAQICKERDEKQNTLEELKRNLEANQHGFETAKAGHETAVLDLQSEHSKKLKEASALHEREVERLRVEHQNRLDQALAEAAELHKKVDAQQIRLEHLAAQHSREIEDLKGTYDAELSQLKSDNAAQLNASNEAHRSELEAAKSQRDEQLESLQTELRQAHTSAEIARATRDKELEALQSNHKEQLEAVNHDLNGLQSRLQETEANVETLKAADSTQLTEAMTALKAVEEQLQISRNALAELGASARAKEASMKSALAEKDGQMSAMQAVLDSVAKEKVTQVTDLEQRVRKLTEDLDAAKFRQNDVEESKAAELKSLAEAHLQKLEQAGKIHSEELDAAHKLAEKDVMNQSQEHEQIVKELREIHQNALHEAKEKSQQEIEDLKQKHDDRLRHLSSEQNEIFTRLKQEHDHTLADKESAMDASLQRIREEHVQELEHRASKHDIAIVDLRRETELQGKLAIERAQGEHERHVSRLNDAFDQERQALIMEHETSLAQHRVESEQAAKGAEKMLEDLIQQHKQELGEKETSHGAASSAARDNHARELADMQAVRKSSAEQLHKTHECELAEAREEHEKRLTSAEASFVAALDELRSEQHDEVSRLHAAHEEEKNALQRELNDSRAAMATQVAHHDLEMQRLRDDHREEQGNIQLKHDAAHQDLDTQSQAENERIQREVDDALSRVSTIETDHKAHMKEVEAKHQAEIKAQLDAQVLERQATLQAHDTKLDSLRVDHETRISGLEAQHSQQIAAVRNGIQSLLAQKEGEHNIAMANLASAHVKTIEDVRQECSQAAMEKERAYEAELTKLRDLAVREMNQEREGHAASLQTAASSHKDAASRLKSDYDAKLTSLVSEHEMQSSALRGALSEAKASHDHAFEQMSAMQRELENMQVAHQESLQAALAQAEADSQTKLSAIQKQHDVALSEVQHELETLRSEHEQAIASIRASLESRTSRMVQMEEEHSQALSEAIANSNECTASRLQTLEQVHTQALSKALNEARVQANEQASLAVQQHQAALDAAIAKARHSGQAEVRNLKKRHQDAVAHIRVSAAKHSAAQLTELEQTHRRELESALQQARRAAEENSASQAAAHARELDKVRVNTSEFQQGELLRLETESASQLADLQARLREEYTAEINAKQESFRAETTAMQARLDATLTGQAEAERASAALRQQLAQADRRVADAKSASAEVVDALTKEKDDLTQQLQQVQTSLRDLQTKHSNGTMTPRASMAAPLKEEVAELKLQISSMEEERATMRSLLQKRLDEKSEIARQNEFLVKELEMLLQQRARPKASPRNTTDALVQTEALVSEPKYDLATVKPMKARASRPSTSYSHSGHPTTPLSPSVRQAKDEIDVAWRTRSFEDYLDNARAELSELGSVISANEALFARKIQEHVGELQRAKDELAADYNAKIDALAHDKDSMERMVTTKQTAAFAKDRKKLLAAYGEEGDDSAEPNAVHPSMPVNQARALRNAEEKLVAEHSKRLSKRKSQIAMKHAEEFQSITQDYDRKIADLLNSRSVLEGDLSVDPTRFENEYGQMSTRSLQLAAERRSASPRSARKSSSPLRARDKEPVATPRPPAIPTDPDTITVPRLRPSAKNERTSTPRTSRSIPRDPSLPRRAFHVGSRDDPDATSQPWQPRDRRGSGKHPPVPQRSLMGPKATADVFSPAPRVVLENASPEPHIPPVPTRGRTNTRSSTNPTLSPKAATNLGIDPTAFELQRQADAVARGENQQQPGQANKNGFLRRMKDRISHDIARPASSQGRPLSRSATTPKITALKTPSRASRPNRSRSRHLSSGMIYYREPAKSPAPAPFDK